MNTIKYHINVLIFTTLCNYEIKKSLCHNYYVDKNR